MTISPLRSVFSAFFVAGLLAQAAGAGAINGVVENGARCKGVSALMRTGLDPRRPEVHQGEYDAASGRFRISGLAEGVYDLRVLVEGGWIDGANLTLEATQKSDEPLTDEARAEILDLINNYPASFQDITRPLAVQGNGRAAKALVELIRYTNFHSGKPGDVIWRVEVWVYEEANGAWVKKPHGWQVLSRVRAPQEMPLNDFLNGLWLFDPALGGIKVTKDRPVVELKYALPAKMDMSMGKAPGSIEQLAGEDQKKKKEKAAEP
jgi:hypothetical protein